MTTTFHDTSPSIRLGGTTPREIVISTWNANKRLDKSVVEKALAIGQRPFDIERRMVGANAITSASYDDQARADNAADKALASEQLDESFKDSATLAHEMQTARSNAKAVARALTSFHVLPSINPQTGDVIRAGAKAFRLLDPVKLSPSTTYAALALSKDAELADIDRDIKRTENSIITFEAAKAKMLADLDTLAESGRLTVRWSGSFRGSIAWPEVNINAAPKVEGFYPRAVDTAAMFARHFRKEIEREGLEALEAFYSGADVVAMTPQERHDELRRLRSVRRAVSRTRIEAVWAGLRAGEKDIWHRADDDAHLLLGIEKNI